MTWHQLRKPRIIGAAVVVALLLTVVLASADYTQRFALTNSDPQPNQEYGRAIAIEGDTIVVAAPFHNTNGIDSGAAYVYKITPNGVLSEFKLVSPLATSTIFFGLGAVAIDDGIIVIGARGAEAVTGLGDSGLVFVYTPDDAGGYTEQVLSASNPQADDDFGRSVAIDDKRIVVGAVGEVYVFEADATGIYTETAILTTSDSDATFFFGLAVAIDDETIVIGDAGQNGSSGAVYVYTADGSGGYDETKLIPSDGVAFDYFGLSVAIEAGRIVVGAPIANATYIYEPDGAGYSETILTGTEPNSGFGDTVAIDNGVIVVGMASNDAIASNAGGVEILTPSLSGYDRETLFLADGAVLDFFGISVGIDNGTVIVGAVNRDSLAESGGAVYVFNADNHELLENRGFENDDSPDWRIKRGTGDRVLCNKDKNGDGDTNDPEDKVFSLDGECAFRFKGSVNENSALQQNISPGWQQFSTGDILSISAAVDAGSNVNGQIIVKVNYFDDTRTDRIKIPLVETSGYDTLFDLMAISSPNVNRIKVTIKHRSPAGRVFIDDISLRLNKASPTNPGYQPLPLPPAPSENTNPDGLRG